jgi:hypothetical protein
MNITSLQNLIKTVDPVTNEGKLNVVTPVFKISATSAIIDIHRVQPHQTARPDLISLRYYGTTSYIDVILKANGISNPFCLKEGMFLLIPEITGAVRGYKPISKNYKPRTQFQDIKRTTPVDKKRLQFLAQKSSTKNNGSTENLPPNMLKTGQQGKTFSPDTILLGSNLGVKTS